jgi:ABC-type proline/glycine betaine transport system permease subunit
LKFCTFGWLRIDRGVNCGLFKDSIGNICISACISAFYMEVLIAVNRIEIGRGLVSGTAVVIIAIILDRVTQGLAQRSEVNHNAEQ